MRPLPRTNQEIFDTGIIFEPDQMPLAWDSTVEEIEASIGSGGGGGGLGTELTGYGRFAGADYFGADATQPRPPSSPALVIELPESKWLVQNRVIELEEPLLIAGVPASMTTGKYGYLSAIEIDGGQGDFTLEILPGNWYSTLQPNLSAQGLACIGKVTTDTETITAIDKSEADVIVPLFALRDLLESLAGIGGGDGGEGGTGEVNRAEFNALKATVEAQGALIAALLEKIGLPGAPGQVDDVDRFEVRETARLRATITRLAADSSLNTDSTVVIGGIAGDGYDLGAGVVSRDGHSGNTHLDLISGEES